MRGDIPDSRVLADMSGAAVTRRRFLRRACATVGGMTAAGGLVGPGAIAGSAPATLSNHVRATLPGDADVARQADALLADAARRRLFRGSALIARRGKVILSKGCGNSGYQVLGYLVELLSGMSYAEFLQRHVFTPLRMVDSGYDVNHPPLPLHATGYATWTTPAGYIDMSVVFADGSLYSTVGDLYRWDREVTSTQPTIVSGESLRQMFTPWVATDASHMLSYGYGWYIGKDGGHRLIDHTGDINGFISDNGFFPDDKVTLIVLSNFESSDGLRQITGHLSGIIFGLGNCIRLETPCTEM